MARILVQTDDYRDGAATKPTWSSPTSPGLTPTAACSRGSEHAVRDAETPPAAAARRGVRHLASIVPVSDYRDVRG